MITTFEVTPVGTNGGISPFGLVASAMGGKFMGFCIAVAASFFDPTALALLSGARYASVLRWSVFGALLGFLGSLVLMEL